MRPHDPRWKTSNLSNDVRSALEDELGPVLRQGDPERYTNAQAAMVRKYEGTVRALEQLLRVLDKARDLSNDLTGEYPEHVVLGLSDLGRHAGGRLFDADFGYKQQLNDIRMVYVQAEEWCKEAGVRTFGSAYMHWNWPNL